MNVNKYLERIGLSGREPDTTLEFLNKIQYGHVTNIPYENLDILSGIPISLDPHDLYDKIVTRKRGGFCFELNRLLAELLTELGFKNRSYLARFLRGESGIPVRRHRVIAVDIDGCTYIVDAGIGSEAPKYPLLLREGEVQKIGCESYKFMRDEVLGWVLYDYHQGEWRRFYSFTEDVQLEVDFIQPSFYCEKHKDSVANKTAMISLKTERGRKTISDRDYKIFEDGALTYIEEQVSEERFSELLISKFGISL